MALHFLEPLLNLWDAVDFDTPKEVENLFNECLAFGLCIDSVIGLLTSGTE